MGSEGGRSAGAHVRPASRRYGVAVATALVAMALRFALDPLLGSRVPYTAAFPAIVIAGWYGGTGPALVVAVLSWTAATYLFVTPSFQFGIEAPSGYAVASFFAIAAAICAFFGGRLHDARNRAEASAAEAQRRLRELSKEIEERTRAEADAKASEARYRALGELVPGIVWSVTRDGRLEYMNQQWHSYTGQTPEELAKYGWQSACHPDDLPSLNEAASRSVIEGQPFRGELRLRRHDGVYRWFYAHAEALRNEAGEAVRYVGLSVDVDDKRRAEEHVARVQRMETVGRLAGGIAHENNNQVAVVLGMADFLLRSDNLTAEQRRDLEDLKRAAERMADLTRQLLAFGRRQMLSPQVLSLHGVIRETRSMLAKVLGPEVRIVLDLCAEPTWILVDRTQVVQVLMNLALNARDAMPQGGVLTFRTRHETSPPSHGRLGKHFDRTCELVLLSVADTGCGMEADLRSRIFEPFFTTKAVGQGSGLGLAVVEGIVEQSGGDLWVESEAGRGTMFTIALPAATPPAALEPRPASARIKGRETVLVVDDEPLVRATFVRALSDAGYQALDAESATQALALLEREDLVIDLLVTDVAMPDISGIELARRARAICPDLPILFVSGHSQEVVAEDRGLPPTGAFLEKPFPPDVLVRRVRAALDERAADELAHSA